MKYKLSIIIPTWNTAEITLKCIKSINHFFQNRYEIIVVDNGSTDNTEQLLSKMNNIKYIKNNKNLGFSKANNIGAQTASGDYLLFLNSDMEIIDNSLEKMLEYIENNQQIGIIGPKFLNIDKSPQASVFPNQNITNAFKEFWLNKKTYSKYIPSTKKPLSVENISGGALLIKKNLFNKIGKWNEKYFMYFEDLDICRKIKKQKKDIIYFPSCSIIHRHGSSGKNITDSKNQWRRLIDSSIKYHGLIYYYLLFLIIWSGQKIQKNLNH